MRLSLSIGIYFPLSPLAPDCTVEDVISFGSAYLENFDLAYDTLNADGSTKLGAHLPFMRNVLKIAQRDPA